MVSDSIDLEATSKNSFPNPDFIRKINFFDVKMNLRGESHETRLFSGDFPRFTLQWALTLIQLEQ